MVAPPESRQHPAIGHTGLRSDVESFTPVGLRVCDREFLLHPNRHVRLRPASLANLILFPSPIRSLHTCRAQ